MFRKTIFFICLMLLFLKNGFTQTYEELTDKAVKFQMSNVDSSIYYFQLAEKIVVAKKDTAKMLSIYSALANHFRIQQNLAPAEKYAHLAVDVSITNYEKSQNLVLLGMVYGYSDLQKGDSIFQIAERITERTDDQSAHYSFLINYASLKKNIGDYYGAIDYYIKGEKLASSDFPRTAIYTDIAKIFLDLNNFDLADQYIQQAIDLAEKNNYKSRFSEIASVKGQILIAQNKLDLAKEELNYAIENFTTKKRWSSLVVAYSFLASIQIKEKDFANAQISSQKSLELYDQVSPQGKCTILATQGKLYFTQKKYEKAILNCDKIIQIATKRKLKYRLKTAHLLASKAHEKLNRHKLALDHFQQYKILNDSLFQSQQTSLVTNLESKHNRKEQQNAIVLLDSENEIQATRLSQQNTLIWVGAIALAIISGLLFFLFKSNKKITTQNGIISNALSEKNVLLKEKDTLLREIHHRVKNNLQLVSSLLGLQSQNITDPKALEAINSGKARVKSMALIHQDLYNRDNLKGISVQEYFQKLCRELISSYQIDTDKIKLKTEIEDINLDVDTLVPLGLITNELLTNALKYAFPNKQEGNIFVKLFEKDKQLFLEIKDNGIGMNVSSENKSSFGIKLVNTLLFQLDGSMNQEKSNGTHLVLSFENFKKTA